MLSASVLLRCTLSCIAASSAFSALALLRSKQVLPQLTQRPLLSKRFPDVIIAGAGKCGTGALGFMIGAHPDVAFNPGELMFYKHMERGRQWYLEHMPPARGDQLVLEKSSDIWGNDMAPREILATNPATKVILIFKDPVSRVLSYVGQRLAQGTAKGKALEDFVLDDEGRLKTEALVLRNSRYAEHLRRWTRLYNSSQLLVLDGGVLVKRPWEELEKVARFLKLSRHLPREAFVPDVAKPGFFCWRQQGDVEPRCAHKSKGHKHKAMPARLEQRLRRYFRPFDRELVSLLGREMSWTQEESTDP